MSLVHSLMCLEVGEVFLRCCLLQTQRLSYSICKLMHEGCFTSSWSTSTSYWLNNMKYNGWSGICYRRSYTSSTQDLTSQIRHMHDVASPSLLTTKHLVEHTLLFQGLRFLLEISTPANLNKLCSFASAISSLILISWSFDACQQAVNKSSWALRYQHVTVILFSSNAARISLVDAT